MIVPLRWPTQLLLASMLVLAGCLQEDSISVTKDGRVSFEAVVTEVDEDKKIEFAAFEKVVANVLDELRQRQWEVEATWTSKERPYRLKFTGSGKLADVAGKTSFYVLSKVDDKKFTLMFLGTEANYVRIGFASPPESAQFSGPNGRPIHEIERALPTDIVTIALQ
jgi:hypothetical protein